MNFNPSHRAEPERGPQRAQSKALLRGLLLTLCVLCVPIGKAQNTPVLADAQTGVLFRPSAALFKSANGLGGAGTGDLLSTNNLSDVADAAAARTNLGLGLLSTPTFAGLGVGTTANIIAPITVGDEGDEIGAVDAQIAVARAVDDAVAGNGHAFTDASVITRGGGMAYNSYDTGVVFQGSESYNHFAGFQSAPSFNATGTLTNYRAFAASLAVGAGATVTTSVGLHAFNPTGSGTVTNAYGAYIEEITKGGTLNYAIFSAGATKSRFYNFVLGGGGSVDTDLFDGSGNPGLRGAALGSSFAGLTIKDSTSRFQIGYGNTSLLGTKVVPIVMQWSGGLTGANSGSLEIGARGTVASEIAFFTSPDAGTTGLVEALRLTAAGNTIVRGTLTAGSAPTTLTDSAGKILSAALNTVAPAQGGTGLTSLGTGVATFLGTPSSANLAAAVTDENGTGKAIFSAGTLDVASGKTLTASQDVTLNRQSSTGLPVEFGIALSDETTAITTGTAKATFRAPFAFTVTEVRASVGTVSSSGLPTVNIKESGTTILSTKITIAANEKTSTTAATAPVISDTAIADDAELTFDIDVAGTGAAGLKVWVKGYR